MKAENLLMFEHLPQTDEPTKKKKKAFNNILYQTLNRLMTHFKVEAVDIEKTVEISKSTLSYWINGQVEKQDLDSNIKKLATFFGVSVDFLAFGTPMTDKDIELDDLMPDFTDNSHIVVNHHRLGGEGYKAGAATSPSINTHLVGE